MSNIYNTNKTLKSRSSDVIRNESIPESNVLLNKFWNDIRLASVNGDVEGNDQDEFRERELPLKRIKRIMKLDDEVQMVGTSAPIVLEKAAEIFITELCLRGWALTVNANRRVLQASDIRNAAKQDETFDFLVDIFTCGRNSGQPQQLDEELVVE